MEKKKEIEKLFREVFSFKNSRYKKVYIVI